MQKIRINNYESPVFVDDEDSDLATITWSYRASNNDFFNPAIGALHRIVAARKLGTDLTSVTYVRLKDGNCCNISRDNLAFIDRATFTRELHKGRNKLQRNTRYITRIIHLPQSDVWKVVSDQSIHPSEDAAIAHLERAS